jgi:hypothetical protein
MGITDAELQAVVERLNLCIANKCKKPSSEIAEGFIFSKSFRR